MGFEFKQKTHVNYVLRGKEVPFYINPATGDFWFKGISLVKVPSAGISNQPSDDLPFSDDDDEEVEEMLNEQDLLGSQLSRKRSNVDLQNPTRSKIGMSDKYNWPPEHPKTKRTNNDGSNDSNSSQKHGLTRQDAIHPKQQFNEKNLDRIDNCRDIEELAKVMQEKFEKFQMPRHLPSAWIKHFETFVNDTSSNNDIDTDNRKLNLLPFFLDKECCSTWFFDQRSQAKKTWDAVKSDFINYFMSKYWSSVRETLSEVTKPEESLHGFLEQKIKKLRQLFPEMFSSSILKHCCASVPIEVALELQDVIEMGIPMFLIRTKAIDKKNGIESAQERASTSTSAAEINANQTSEFQQIVKSSLESMLSSKNFFDSITNVVKQSLNTTMPQVPNNSDSHTVEKLPNHSRSFTSTNHDYHSN